MADRERQPSHGQWWENYYVRYFVGTVIGAAAIVFLNEFSSSPLHGRILPSLKDFKDTGAMNLAAIAALGFAYCYIASAPVLAIHAIRGQVDLVSMKIKWWFWIVTIFLVVLLCIGLAHVVPFQWHTQSFLSLVFFSLVVGVQIALIVAAHTNRFARVADFYWKLTDARSKDSLHVHEYVESYRHLREHGNAFAIIILELGLATVLVSVPSPSWLVLFLTIWVLPASYCWLIGTLLEARLTHR